MPLRGPCGNPTCKFPDRASGQWQYIPEDFDEQVRDDAICTCKKADCLRYFGLKDPAGKPGRKRALDDADAAEGVGRREPVIPAKYIVNKVHTILSCRCARPSACVAPEKSQRAASQRARCMRGRRARITDLSPEERAGNTIRDYRLEYAISGHFWMSKTDKIGTNTTLWVPYKTLLRDVGEDIDGEIDIYEGDIAMLREEETGEFEEEEGEEGGGENDED